ncbi:TIGR02281 family clan AA aspartic protease [Roseateles sp. BYS180W]|uniref:TIGR02281 family clan AA aspartic protease n=1 Tax=Roseateles rivi TaxID=3299028 RepID=A0ABW7FZK5_9BURK
MTRRGLALLLWGTLSLCCASAWPQAAALGGPHITFNGSLGKHAALLLIDGQALTLQLGQSARGVRLLAIQDDHAEVEVLGQRRRLQLGESPAQLGVEPKGTLTAQGQNGHFYLDGSINGTATRFLVDTGASLLTLGLPEAQRLGLALHAARKVTAQTANGAVEGQLVTIKSLRLGGIELTQVEAMVLPAAMPHVLLGNSVLSRFQMRRDADQMVLTHRN